MAYTNLPNIQNTNNSNIDQRIEKFEFNQNDYDAIIGFLIKKGFTRTASEETASVLLKQAKIESLSIGEIMDLLGNESGLKLSELITVILNADRYKSSKLGFRSAKTANNIASRNIIT